MHPPYVRREDVKRALDVAETTHANHQIDRAIYSGSRLVDSLCRRTFWPETATKLFDWPNENQRGAAPWQLRLDGNELVSVSAVSVAGTAIDLANVILEPSEYGPPFNVLELLLDSGATFSGASTHQQAVALTGVYGFDNDVAAVTTLASNVDGTQTFVEVLDGSQLGVGDLITINAERMITTGRAFITSGTTSIDPVTLDTAADFVNVATPSDFAAGEVIIIDSEKMIIHEVTSGLIVERAWDGSTLAAHSAGTAIFVDRWFKVSRAETGSVAAVHTAADVVLRQVYNSNVVALALAESIALFEQERSAYARTVGSGDNQREARGAGLGDLRKMTKRAVGRSLRVGSV